MSNCGENCNKVCLGFVKAKEFRFDDPTITLGVMICYNGKYYIKGQFQNLLGGFSYNDYNFIEIPNDAMVSPLGKHYQCKFLEISFLSYDLMEEMIMQGPEFYQKVFHGKDGKH